MAFKIKLVKMNKGKIKKLMIIFKAINISDLVTKMNSCDRVDFIRFQTIPIITFI